MIKYSILFYKCQEKNDFFKKYLTYIEEGSILSLGGIDMTQVSAHFTEDELNCNCGCGFSILRPAILEKLQFARTLAGFPFNISSWCRCPIHNKNVGGSDTSSHLDGWAIDIDEDDLEKRIIILYCLLRAGFARVGIGINKNLVHVDDDPKKLAAIWFYYAEKEIL